MLIVYPNPHALTRKYLNLNHQELLAVDVTEPMELRFGDLRTMFLGAASHCGLTTALSLRECITNTEFTKASSWQESHPPQ